MRPTAAAANDVMMRSVSGPLVDMPESGASRIPASAASEHPSAHEKLETSSERAPRKTCEAAVVDDGPHRNAEARSEQQDAQSRSASATATPMREQAGPGEGHACDVDPALSEQLRERVADVLVPDHVGQPDEREHQADGHQVSCTTSSLPCRCRMIARSRKIPSSGAATSTVSGTAITWGTPWLTRQLPVDVREEHADRALREVEDARGGVDDDEARRRHREDAGDRATRRSTCRRAS